MMSANEVQRMLNMRHAWLIMLVARPAAMMEALEVGMAALAVVGSPCPDLNYLGPSPLEIVDAQTQSLLNVDRRPPETA
jgi:hypothetical protein